MRSGPAQGDIRIVGADRPAVLRPPRLPLLIAIGAMVGVAVAATFLSHVDDGIDAAFLDNPAFRPETPTTTIAPTTTVVVETAGEPDGVLVVPDPLDGFVPGFTGTLVMTAWHDNGLELWTWTSGSEGTLRRVAIATDLFDARPNLTGDRVAALAGPLGETPWLVVSHGSEVTPVFFGAQSFAWHSTDPGRIAWLSERTDTESPTLYVGTRNDGGIYFEPVVTLNDFGTDRPSLRLVGYDGTGFVVEAWTSRDDTLVPTVERLDLAGHPLGTVEGAFVGVSPVGGVAVNDDDTTEVSTVGTGTSFHLQSASTSAVWSSDGRRLATTPVGGTGVRIEADGSETTIDVHLEHLMALAWSPDGRFLVVTGDHQTGRALAFIDTIDGSVRSVSIDASPVGAVVAP